MCIQLSRIDCFNAKGPSMMLAETFLRQDDQIHQQQLKYKKNKFFLKNIKQQVLNFF